MGSKSSKNDSCYPQQPQQQYYQPQQQPQVKEQCCQQQCQVPQPRCYTVAASPLNCGRPVPMGYCGNFPRYEQTFRRI